MGETSPVLPIAAEDIIDSIHEPVLILSPELRVQRANSAFLRIFKLSMDRVVGQTIFELDNGAWTISALRQLLNNLLPATVEVQGFKLSHDFPSIGRKDLLVNARQVSHASNGTAGIVLAITEVTERTVGTATGPQNQRDGEAHLRRMSESTSSMTWMTDSSGNCSDLGESWYAYTGRTPQQDLGRGWLENLHADDRRRALEAFADASHRQEGFHLDCRIRRLDREFRWSVMTGWLRFDSNGTFQGYVGTINDDHERMLAELATREAQSRLESILAAGDVATWEFDVINNRVRADRNLARMFRVTPTSAAGGPIEDYLQRIHPEDRERVTRVIGQALQVGDSYEAAYRLVSPDQPVRWVVARGRIERDASGRATRLPGVIIDVTSQREAEEALKVSETRFRTLFESMDEGFCIIEMLFDDAGRPCDYRFLETNPAFEKQCNLVNVVGKRIRELVPNQDAHWFEIYGRVATTGVPIRFVNRGAAMGGWWWNAYAFRVDGPESRRVAVLFNDITEQKRVEEIRERLVVELQDQHRANNEFLTMLADELRNPSAPIGSSLQRMELSADDSSIVRQAVTLVDRRRYEMGRLIDEFLESSRTGQDDVRSRHA